MKSLPHHSKAGPLQLDLPISIHASKVSLAVDITATEQDLQAFARTLGVVGCSQDWWWGDLLNAADERQILLPHEPLEKYEGSTLKRWRDVSAFYAPKNRQERLSWAHHEEIMVYCGRNLPAALKLLKEAAEQNWTRAELRRQIRERAQKTKGVQTLLGEKPSSEGGATEFDPGPVRVYTSTLFDLDDWASSAPPVKALDPEARSTIKLKTYHLYSYLKSIHES